MKKKMPKFKSEKEEARFWDTHSPMDYVSEFVDIEEPFKINQAVIKKAAGKRAERKRLLTLRMEQRQIDLAKVIAEWKGLGYQTQMRVWVVEGIRREIAAHPEIKKFFIAK